MAASNRYEADGRADRSQETDPKTCVAHIVWNVIDDFALRAAEFYHRIQPLRDVHRNLKGPPMWTNGTVRNTIVTSCPIQAISPMPDGRMTRC
jgi:hypothetical protein